MLLLHRQKPPNRHLYSPIGGKLEQDLGESPTECALREIHEETGLVITPDKLHLTGMISECGYLGQAHWLMFLFEVTVPVTIEPQRMSFDEGQLEWHEPDAIGDLPIPDTDRQVIWPLFWQYRGRFFAAHIDCTGDQMAWRIEQPAAEGTPNAFIRSKSQS